MTPDDFDEIAFAILDTSVADVAYLALILSFWLKTTDEEVLSEMGLDPVELKVVGERYRKYGIWRDEGIEFNSDPFDFRKDVDVGRGILVRDYDGTEKPLVYSYASDAARRLFMLRENINDIFTYGDREGASDYRKLLEDTYFLTD